MKSSSIIKVTFLLLLLIGAHVLLGMTCNKVQNNYTVLVPSGSPSLELALWGLGSILLCLLMSGLVAALVRPLGVVALGFLLSALGMVWAWGFNIYSAVASLLYFGIAFWFGRSVVDEIKNRIAFSTAPIQQGQKLLIFGLVLMIGASFAFGFRDAAIQSGELIPSAFKQQVSESIASGIQTRLENQGGQDQGNNAKILQGIPQGLDKFWSQLEALLETHPDAVPYVFGLLVVWILFTLLSLLAWFPPRLVEWVVLFLKGAGFAHEITEPAEVRRLVLD